MNQIKNESNKKIYLYYQKNNINNKKYGILCNTNVKMQ